MPKRYESASSEVFSLIQTVRDRYYTDLEPVTVGALFCVDQKGVPCLKHQGYPAAAICRIVPAMDRAAGLQDAQIVIDRAVWQDLNLQQKTALIDHELHHIETVLDDDGQMQCDAQDRPKLKIRKHDWQFGWFDEVANRHGKDSMEVRQAQQMVEASGQLYFDFARLAAA